MKQTQNAIPGEYSRNQFPVKVFVIVPGLSVGTALLYSARET